MLNKIAKKLFGSANERFIKKLSKTINHINAIEPDFEKLSDQELRAKTKEYMERHANGETLDELLPEAFATVREAAKRTLGQRHYDVQLVGGIVLHKGMISEMKTGEGKTLVATLAAYLNALNGKGVHVVTVNDYLAKRDAEWMGQVYRFLGLTVDYIIHQKAQDERKQAYAADILYATNNELGFDYLRDNMRFHVEELVQREFNFAIVDEVDSILIDEARTPLIISGAAEDSSEKYILVNKIIPMLKDADYEKDEKQKSVTLTEAGMEHVEKLLKEVGLIKDGSLYDIVNVSLVQHVNQALRAHKMHIKDIDYIVKNNSVVIIDEFTGRMMEGRRYSDGLHQAIEAKEGVHIQSENQTLASITFQNYFRLYPKLSGMTGTAMTEEAEFLDIYNLPSIEIPTNKGISRKDFDDEIYKTEKEKFEAITKTIVDCHDRGQPILVGTTSIEKSELLANMLTKNTKVKFEILNAKHHEREAHIIAQAGHPGAVTIATNMAGRGTDIQLGGNLDMRLEAELKGTESEAEVLKIKEKLKKEIEVNKQKALEAGGLYVLGTERHESRRIDNQLRGRSGRQGDPGTSKFYLSLEDDLMRIFGSDKMGAMLNRMGLPEGEPLIHPFISKALEKAQSKVEERNFDIRKNLLKYDNVMNDQRKVIYEQRKAIMQADNVSEKIEEMRQELLSTTIYTYLAEDKKDWNIENLSLELLRITGFNLPIQNWANQDITAMELEEKILTSVEQALQEKNKHVPADLLKMVEKTILLQVLDGVWKEHIATLDHMRHTIVLRAYGQKDPLNEYKKEAFNMFSEMLDILRDQVTFMICRSAIKMDAKEELERTEKKYTMQENHGDKSEDDGKQKAPIQGKRIARNDSCPCGSSKKYKHCCGKY